MDTGGGDKSNAQRHMHAVDSKHKIFLSHSGAQKGFVEQVCVDLENRDRYPFFDIRWGSLPIGDHFPKLIFQAIQQCQVGVVFFSEEFFTRSKWPMLELVAMVKRMKDRSFTIMPVFLGISLEDYDNEVNHSRSSVWCGWAQSDERIDVGQWEKAVEQIVGAICNLVEGETKFSISHVQGKSHIFEVIHEKIKATDVSQNIGICVVGLYGVGGIGKTTSCKVMCKVMCNEMRGEFNDKVCHVEFGGENELKMLQSMMRRLIGTRNEDVERLKLDKCRDRLERNLRNHRVFLAIDNVTDTTMVIGQAKALLKFGYGEGSVVLVTARSCDQLKMVNIHENDCIEMPELEEREARSLLLYHAAPSNHVDENVLKSCVQRCYFRKGNGNDGHFHPLALEVFGLQLGADADEWIVKLKEVDPFNQLQEPVHPIFSVLRKSFDTLNDEDKILFMDVAFFFPRLRKYVWWLWVKLDTRALEWLYLVHGGSAEDLKMRLKGLKKKSLLQSVDERSGKIGIHDLWSEFAVMEANVGTQQLSFWVSENDEDDQNNRGRGGSRLRCGGWSNLRRALISSVDRSEMREEVNLSLCSNLTVLTLQNVRLVNVLDRSALKCLEYLEVLFFQDPHEGFEVVGLGSLGRLVVLRLLYLRATSALVKEIGFLTNLQVLHLHFPGGEKTELLDLSRLSMLRSFSLNSYQLTHNSRMISSWLPKGLRRLSEKIRGVERCRGLGALGALEEISLAGYYGLERLPNLHKLRSLRKLDISDCSLIKAVPGLDELVALQEFVAKGCARLEKLPNLRKLSSLWRLDISECSLIKALPGLDELVTLEEVNARFCRNLAELPDMCKLTSLRRLYLVVFEKESFIKAVPGLSRFMALEEVRVSLEVFEDVPDLHNLSQLSRLFIMGWSSGASLSVASLPNLTDLTIMSCEGLPEPTGLSSLTGLEFLSLLRCGFEDVSCLSNLTALERLRLVDCKKLKKLPESLLELTGLKYLSVRGCTRSVEEEMKRLGAMVPRTYFFNNKPDDDDSEVSGTRG